MLASIEEKAGPQVSRYRVNVQNIDEVVRIFLKSVPQADIVLVDEIGKMELYSVAFSKVVERLIKTDKPLIAVVHRRLAKRYEKVGKLFWVAKSNWDEIKAAVLAELV